MKYWQNGFYLNQNKENSRIELTDEYYKELLKNQSQGQEIYSDANGYPRLRNYVITEEMQKNIIRSRRKNECFNIVNRGQVWYDTLNDEQKNEIAAWYHDWLDAPDSMNIPTKPDWIIL